MIVKDQRSPELAGYSTSDFKLWFTEINLSGGMYLKWIQTSLRKGHGGISFSMSQLANFFKFKVFRFSNTGSALNRSTSLVLNNSEGLLTFLLLILETALMATREPVDRSMARYTRP
ncbi:hypothetical protein WICPIJ_001985 [Wickerhamomyces pijperi]|uniref:Uncharacterized protein n=1 Tax=Wickerhamomyces pijperi TaxID=599730 RepID=A0A9P8QAP4_WICPI|nr:hypothetical protein WICPIJ_001985 [Wickerhamomyces pijperi]